MEIFILIIAGAAILYMLARGGTKCPNCGTKMEYFSSKGRWLICRKCGFDIKVW